MKFTLFSATLLLLAATNSAQLSHRGSILAENLGLLLGLPLDLDMPRGNYSAAPDFLMNVYNCWSALGSSKNRADCLPPVHDPTVKDQLEDVNVVRSIKGTAMQSSTPGVYSHSHEGSQLPASFSLKFNMSLMQRLKEDIRYAYITVSKSQLSEDKLEYIKNRCNQNNEDIPLQLLVKVNASQDSYTLLTSAVLSGNALGRKQMIEFGAITPQFKDWVDEITSSKTFDIIETKIIVGGGCYNLLTPSDLGVGQDTENSAYIVVFSKSDDSEEAIIKAGLAELAAEATAARQKRNTDSTQSDDSNSDQVSSEPPTYTFNITNYHLHPCRRYSHTISFEELGWRDYILQPESYEANFCAGSCNYPLTNHYNTTKHSYIQSLAARLNPTLVPPPCCAPHELKPVTVLYERAPEHFVTHEWHGMRAESCGCK